VEDQLANCQCHSQFSGVRVDDGKYKVMFATSMSEYSMGQIIQEAQLLLAWPTVLPHKLNPNPKPITN